MDITPEETRQQVEDFIAWRHRKLRKPNTDELTGADKYQRRTEIDSKLADQRADEESKEVWEGL